MRREKLLSTVPFIPVHHVRELYSIAVDAAQKAAQRYGRLAARTEQDFWPVRCVFEVLATRERDRIKKLSAACFDACGAAPQTLDLASSSIDLVPEEELADIGNSHISTPYNAWALAVRHRQRAFVFWTYVIALAEDSAVRTAAESLANEALWDGNLLRRERRLAWREEQRMAAENTATENHEPISAALLESLLSRDILAWSKKLPSAEGERLLALNPFFPSGNEFSPAEERNIKADENVDLEPLQRRALQRAEQLSNIYLEDADNATDQHTMELSQKLAARSIMRLAGLRDAASALR